VKTVIQNGERSGPSVRQVARAPRFCLASGSLKMETDRA
jgi:hypothetical protein